jgi:hypothetical protein
MKTPRRKKKQIDVTVDTPNIDATIQRDEEGNVNIDIDSKRVDVHVEKTEDKISIDIEIDDKAVYQFESNGKAARMPKGMIFKISGAMLKLFLKQGFGRLKK